MNILIVDDSGVMRRIHKNTLLENKIPKESLIEAQNGEEALQKAKENNITLFLVDWNMPKLDGLEFVKRLRSSPRYENTPIIMVTSEAAKYNVLQAITAGVTDYVVKPIRGNVLWEKVSTYLNKG